MNTEEEFYYKFQRILDISIDREKKETTEDIEYEINDEDHQEYLLSKTESIVVNAFYKALKKTQEYTVQKYKHSLSRRGKRFPTNWMFKDKRIRHNLEKYRIVDILNYLDKQTRYIRGDDYKQMVGLTDTVTGGKKYPHPKSKKVYEYAVFIADAEFYGKMTAALHCSKKTIQKYLQVFARSRIILKLGKVNRYGGTLYADGYYVQWDDKPVKKPFLINSKRFRNALRNFKIR